MCPIEVDRDPVSLDKKEIISVAFLAENKVLYLNMHKESFSSKINKKNFVSINKFATSLKDGLIL